MRRLEAGQPVPDFCAQSMQGKEIRPSTVTGAPFLLIFHRYARCAVCNERIRELRQTLPAVQARTGLRVAFVCHSDRNRLLTEFGQAKLPFDVIPDPKRNLYALFGVARSMARTLRASSIGTIVRARRAMPNDGRGAGLERPLTMIPAEFFIDPTGTIAATHYGEFLGDTWSGDTIERLAHEHRQPTAAGQ